MHEGCTLCYYTIERISLMKRQEMIWYQKSNISKTDIFKYRSVARNASHYYQKLWKKLRNVKNRPPCLITWRQQDWEQICGQSSRTCTVQTLDGRYATQRLVESNHWGIYTSRESQRVCNALILSFVRYCPRSVGPSRCHCCKQCKPKAMRT